MRPRLGVLCRCRGPGQQACMVNSRRCLHSPAQRPRPASAAPSPGPTRKRCVCVLLLGCARVLPREPPTAQLAQRRHIHNAAGPARQGAKGAGRVGSRETPCHEDSQVGRWSPRGGTGRQGIARHTWPAHTPASPAAAGRMRLPAQPHPTAPTWTQPKQRGAAPGRGRQGSALARATLAGPPTAHLLCHAGCGWRALHTVPLA